MAKRALLIGINKYQIPGADLRGCVNDVKDLSAALVEFYGFKKRDIKVLLDGAATKKAMQAGITDARARGEEGRRRLCSTTPATGRTCPTTQRTGTRPTAVTRFCARRISTGTSRSATTG